MDNRDILIWLNSIQGIGEKTINKLYDHFKNLTDLWYCSKNDIMQLPSITDNIKRKLIDSRSESYYNHIITYSKSSDVKIITILDEEYPENLRNIYNPPKVLYLKGNYNLMYKPSIAIVGSRKATYYGKWVTERLSKELSSLGICIISGMALGIDAVAHKGALDHNGETIAVLGSGVDRPYPKRNIGIYNDISKKGLVVSEFPLGMEAIAGNFPLRNRIISGLSLGILVIEAKEKSGSLITAYHGLEQGKDIFAVPGNINSIYSKGTNLLIKDGAKIVTKVEDILEEIPKLRKLIKENEENSIKYDDFSDKEVSVIKAIHNGPIHSDMIAYNTGIYIVELNSILTILEMKNVIKALPGKVYTINNF
ncbi:DNA-processing protein DprA [Clostridium sp. D2Q-11]|uniref:DNA-processing protein DprA n=1 Tax=Anaeromonas frigoriresistens TaxID=2683708 RepID=A0A942UV73_9FIRM|nr:DNA-processing protein DprA [Anaeromonas frigoriresistens]MBS4539834.1 DNA-processing protein DprA [Anaeromonas frigoriresistens]